MVTIRETKIKNIMRYHLTPVKMATLKYLQITNSGKGVEKREPIYIVGRNVNWCNHYEKHTCCMLSCFSRAWLFAILLTVAHQDSLYMRFYRQKYWSGLPCPPPGVLPDPGIKPTSFMSPELAGGFFTTSSTWGAWKTVWSFLNKLKIELPYDLAIPLLDIYPNKIIIQKHIWSFISALFTTAKT